MREPGATGDPDATPVSMVLVEHWFEESKQRDGIIRSAAGAASTTMLTAGSRLGPYVIRAPIGAGGMGEVYRAHDANLDRDVAIKILPPALAADPSALARFEREAKAVAALSHPHILAIHDFGRDSGLRAAVSLWRGPVAGLVEWRERRALERPR